MTLDTPTPMYVKLGALMQCTNLIVIALSMQQIWVFCADAFGGAQLGRGLLIGRL